MENPYYPFQFGLTSPPQTNSTLSSLDETTYNEIIAKYGDLDALLATPPIQPLPVPEERSLTLMLPMFPSYSYDLATPTLDSRLSFTIPSELIVTLQHILLSDVAKLSPSWLKVTLKNYFSVSRWRCNYVKLCILPFIYA